MMRKIRDVPGFKGNIGGSYDVADCFYIVLYFSPMLIFLDCILQKPQKNAKDGSVTYVCSECGSRHCNCYKEDHLSSKE